MHREVPPYVAVVMAASIGTTTATNNRRKGKPSSVRPAGSVSPHPPAAIAAVELAQDKNGNKEEAVGGLTIAADAPVLEARQTAPTMYDMFLNLKPSNEAIKSLKTPIEALNKEFLLFRSKGTSSALSDLTVSVILACVLTDILGTFEVVTASSLRRHPVAISALVAVSVSAVLFVASLAHRFFHTHRGEAEAAANCFGCLRRLCLRFDQSSLPVRAVNDTFIVLLTLATGLATVARVVHGDCGDHYSQALSGSDRDCHSAADVAVESYAMCLFVVLLLQVCCKGASRGAICLSWAISVVLLNLSLSLATAATTMPSPYAWIRTNVHFLLLVAISYELERRDLQRFLSQQASRSALEDQQQQAAAAAQQALTRLVDDGRREQEAKRSMVRHVSHEIRTPLNITAVGMDITAAELKKLGDRVPAFLLSTVESCQEACASSLEVLNDLLAFEKLAAGMFTVDRTPLALAPFLRDVAKLFALSAQAKRVQVEMTGGDRPLVVGMDRVKMKTVFRNLLSNAVKFSPIGGTVTIDIDPCKATDTAGAHVVVSVQDSGAGMSGENLQQLFGEGVQFNANALQGGGGSGFGLYIAKGIVDLHGGQIWAESEGEGCGSTFFVTLPLLPAGTAALVVPEVSGGMDAIPGSDQSGPSEWEQEQEQEQEHASRVGEASVGGGGGERPRLNILVVDDSDMTRKLVMRKLRSLGHTCVEAEDGVQAVSMVVGSLVNSEDSASLAPLSGAASGAGSFLVARTRHPLHGASLSAKASPRGQSSAPVASVGLTRASQARHAHFIDLVLIDSNMPRMGGLDATFEMRRWGYSGVIVAVSGEDSEEQFLRAGANAFLIKPLNSRSLSNIIDQHFAVVADGTGAGTSAGAAGVTYNRKGSRSIFRAPTGSRAGSVIYSVDGQHM